MKTIIKGKKDIDKVRIMKNILVSKYGLNDKFCDCSLFISNLFSKYLILEQDTNAYFDENKITYSNDVIGSSPYTLTVTSEGNLKITCFSELITNSPDWPQHFKIETEILYLLSENGFKEITKVSHLYRGMYRTQRNPEGEMISRLDYIDYVMREFEGNIETNRLATIVEKNEDCDIDDYRQSSISCEEIKRLEDSKNLVSYCKTQKIEGIRDILGKINYLSISLLERDETFKEKATYHQVSRENGYAKKDYSLSAERLNELFVPNINSTWDRNWSRQTIEEVLLKLMRQIDAHLSIPYDNDTLDMYLSLLKCFIGRINYQKIKTEFEKTISEACVEKDEEFIYDIEDGQLVKVSPNNAKLF